MTQKTAEVQEKPVIGKWVEGYEVPVINERAVRAAAGILFLFGFIALAFAWKTGERELLKPFGIFFMFDMMTRLILGDRWSPTMLLGQLIVRRQTPEWVGASQKNYAWGLGFVMAIISCFAMGFFGASLNTLLALCSVCVAFLFVEAAFGICVGCQLQKLFSKKEPMYCPGGVCSTSTEHTHTTN